VPLGSKATSTSDLRDYWSLPANLSMPSQALICPLEAPPSQEVFSLFSPSSHSMERIRLDFCQATSLPRGRGFEPGTKELEI